MAGLIQNQMSSGATSGSGATTLKAATPQNTGTVATAPKTSATSQLGTGQIANATSQLPVSTPGINSTPSPQIAGSLTTAPMTSGAEGAPGSVSQYNAQQNSLAPNETVAGNLQSVLAQSSPLMTQARTQGLEQANARGLANSSIGIESAQQAVTAAALPIAQQDAQTALSLAQTNQASENQALANNASAQNQYGLQQIAGQQSLDLASVQNNAQVQLANINNQNKLLLQADSSAGSFYDSIAQGISNILEQPNISVADKQTLVQDQTALLQSGLAIIGNISNLDLGSLLNFGNTALAPPTTQAPAPISGAPPVAPPGSPLNWQNGSWNGNTYTSGDGNWLYNNQTQQWSANPSTVNWGG